METTYKFSAYNAESVYAFGTESEAQRYLEVLNAGKEINLFEMEEASLTDDEAENLAVNLCDEFSYLSQG